MSGYPKQKDSISKNGRFPQDNREAIAPYNFVELPDQIVHAEEVADQQQVKLTEQDREQAYPFLVRQDRYFGERHTGSMSCTLVADSPIYVRTGLSPEAFAAIAGKGFHELNEDQKQHYAQFFGLNSKPTIPGSSLRGMLRELVEIAGHGKVTRVTDKQRYFFRAVGAQKEDPLAKSYRDKIKQVRAGYLVKVGNDWKIRPAQVLNNQTYLWVRQGDAKVECPSLIPFDDEQYKPQYFNVSFNGIFIRNGRYFVQEVSEGGPGIYTGMLVTSGNMKETGSAEKSPRSNHCVVLPIDQEAVPIPIDDKAVEDYYAGLTEFQKEQFSEQYGFLKDGCPIFYVQPQQGGIVIYFGQSPNFRFPYRYQGSERAASPRDFVPAALRDPSVTDLAEALFGYVPDSDNDSRQPYAGRVFVEDAPLTLAEGQRIEDLLLRDGQKPYVTPRILGSPKPTTFQHYLVQENDQRGQLKHYASKPETETVIRGHKLYWHQENARRGTNTNGQPQSWLERVRENPQRDVRQSKQHTGIQPLVSGARFKVCIRFENLSNVELGALLWLMQVGGEEGYRLKIGMGKPLGMGSVRLEELEIVCSDRRERYATLFDTQRPGRWGISEGAMTGQEQDDCIRAFQQHVLQYSGLQAPSFDELPRIQMLRVLLGWPGPKNDSSYRPAQDRTRYMEIERPENEGYVSGRPRSDKVNEYANRPVLPGPWQVLEQPAPTRYPVTPPSAPPRQMISALPKQVGIIEQLATTDQPGRLQDTKGRSYPYLLEDVVADALLVQYQRVLFHQDKRKIAEGKGKKGQEKKWKPCAVEVEPYP